MSFADQISKNRGQPATVRIGVVTSISPLEVTVQATVYRNVGVLNSYLPQLYDVVALIGQSAVSADGSSWLVLGRASVSDAAYARTGVIARGSRITSSSGTTTEIGVLRLDDISIFEGRLYRVSLATSTLFGSTVANDLIEGRFYYSITGAAVVGVNVFGVLSIETRTAGGAQYSDAVSAFLPSPVVATTDGSGTGTLSVVFSIVRTVGAGTISVPSSATYPINMIVEDLGPDPGDTGVDI
jgi:hypothetical protein